MPLTRRHFVALSAALAQTSVPKQLRPRALRPGDTVGLITPSTYVSDPDRLALAEHTLKYFELKPKFGRNVRKRNGYLGGSVNERLEDLHAMFADRSVNAVFAIRGGYGSAQLLDRIDYSLLRKNPKIFLGYSDITAMHLAIQKRAGLVTFHGPVALSGFSEYTQSMFRRALFETKPLGAVTNPPDANQLRPKHTLRAIRPGKARGP